MTLKTLKNHPKKLHTNGSWECFFSLQPRLPKKSPKLHFRFINSFMQLCIFCRISRLNELFYGSQKICQSFFYLFFKYYDFFANFSHFLFFSRCDQLMIIWWAWSLTWATSAGLLNLSWRIMTGFLAMKTTWTKTL